MEIVIHSSRLRSALSVEGVTLVRFFDREGVIPVRWGAVRLGMLCSESDYGRVFNLAKLPDIEQPKEERRPDHSYKAVKERTKFFVRRK